MNKKTLKIIDYSCLFLLLFLGSMLTYLAMNLFWSDIANYANAFNWPLTISTYPMFTFALAIVTFAILFVRYLASEKQYRLHLVKHYLKIFIGYNVAGIITTILSITYVYGNILTPCPFPGSLIVYLLLHLLFLGGNIWLLIKIKQKLTPEDIKFITTHKYRWYTAFIAIFTFIAFDRAGAGFISPVSIQWRNLDVTWFFYLSLFMPMAVLITLILFKLKRLDLADYKTRSIVWGIYTILSIALATAVVLRGVNDSVFVSLISPAMPIERLATIPIDFILLYAPAIIISLLEFIKSLILYLKRK